MFFITLLVGAVAIGLALVAFLAILGRGFFVALLGPLFRSEETIESPTVDALCRIVALLMLGGMAGLIWMASR